MAIKKVYELAVDLKRTSVRVNIPVLVQGDSAEFRIRLLDNGAELSTAQLTGITAVKMQSGYDAQTVIQTVGALEGSVAVFRLQKGELFRSGTVQAMVQLEDADDRISTLRFQYQVIPDLEGNYVPGEQDVTIFQRYISDAQKKIDDINAAAEELAATDVAQLTVKLAEKEYYQNETDFVEYLRSQLNFDKMTLIVTNNANMKEFNVILSNERSKIRYNFKKGDDFIYLSGVYKKGITVEIDSINHAFSTFVKTGSWNSPGATQINYAITVGSKITKTLTTEGTGRLFSEHYCDNRSGLFKVTLDDLEPIIISTYNPTVQTKSFPLFHNVPKGDHVVTFEFMGDDPNNPPSGGVSRGWTATADGKFLTVIEQVATESAEVELMSNGSIKEFAFSIKPENGAKNDWLPRHGGVNTMFNKSEPILVLDNVEYLFDDLGQNLEYGISDFKFIQSLYGRNPETGDVNLVDFDVTHSLDLGGVMGISGLMEVIQPIQFNLSYVMMAPVNNGIFDKLLTGIGNSYACTKADGSKTFLTETNQCKNYAFMSSSNDSIVAVRHTDIRNNLLYGKAEQAQFDNFIDHRDAVLVKHYLNVFKPATTFPIGYIYRWQGDLAVGDVKSIYK